MRFDYFEDIWKTYESTFETLGISKEDAMSVYDANFSKLRKVGEGEIEFLGYAIQFKDMTFGDENIQNFASGYTAFKEGKIYILPVGFKDISDTIGKAIAFGSEKIRFVSASSIGLMVEDYYPKTKQMTTKIYDKSTLEFLQGQGITFNNINDLTIYIYSARLIPDVSVKIKQHQDPVTQQKVYKATVESVDNNYELTVDYMVNPNYEQLRNATRKEMTRLDSMVK